MIRVAHIVGKMSGGGVESVVMSYYRHVDRSRVQFDLLVDSDSSLVPREEVEALDGRIVEIPPYQQVLTYQRCLRQTLAEGRWPIVHSHISTLSVFSLRAAKAAGVPVRIAHSHMAWNQGLSAKGLVENSLRHLSGIYPTHRLACSQAAGEWLFGKTADFDLMYNAIDLKRFAFSEAVRADVRRELGVADTTLVVGHIGRFCYQKNHPFLLRAFKELRALREDCVLVCAGGGEQQEREQTMRLAQELGLADSVRLFGHYDHPERLYSAFDVFALPSYFEGLAIVSVEAQAAGLPCLVSDRTTSEANISGAMRYLPIDDPRVWAEELGAVAPGARQVVRQDDFAHYDIVRAGEWLTGYYERLAASGAPALQMS